MLKYQIYQSKLAGTSAYGTERMVTVDGDMSLTATFEATSGGGGDAGGGDAGGSAF